MAIGDVTQLKLLQKSLTTTSTDSVITNSSSSIKTTITSITLSNTSTSTRTVSMYMYGTGTSNVVNFKLDANSTVITTQLDYVLSNTESFYFKQDTGTDVNIAVMGVSEVIV